MSETRTIFDPFHGNTVEIRKDLTMRLRGKYASGPTLPNGEPEFGWREFGPVPPIQVEAANEIERLQAENFALAADQCHAGYGTEHGDHRCNYQDVINKLRAALEPFAKIADAYEAADARRTTMRRDELGGSFVYRTDDSCRISVSMGELRRARAALEPKP